MSQQPKTIQIYLPSGDARGIRVAEITTRIVRAIEVPRSLLSDFYKMPDSQQVGLYVLVGQSDEGNPLVYIGQTGDLKARLTSHDRNKDFWDRAMVVTSRTNSLTQTHTLFLEWHSLKQCRSAGRYKDENGNEGSRPHTPAPLEAECNEIFESAEILLATLGYPLFEPLVKKQTAANEEEKFFCTNSGADGEGLFTNEGFVVLKGSKGKLQLVDSAKGTYVETSRKRLLDAGVLKIVDDTVVFAKDHLFGTPSPAACALMARKANGWTNWKNKNGKTLAELKRLPENED